MTEARVRQHTSQCFRTPQNHQAEEVNNMGSPTTTAPRTFGLSSSTSSSQSAQPPVPPTPNTEPTPISLPCAPRKN